MFCKHCGSKLMVGVSVCPFCGNSVVYENINPNMKNNDLNTTSYTPKKEKKDFTGLFIIGGILLVILLIFIIKALN